MATLPTLFLNLPAMRRIARQEHCHGDVRNLERAARMSTRSAGGPAG